MFIIKVADRLKMTMNKTIFAEDSPLGRSIKAIQDVVAPKEEKSFAEIWGLNGAECNRCGTTEPHPNQFTCPYEEN